MKCQFQFSRFGAVAFLSVSIILFFSTQIFANSADPRPDLKFQQIHEGLVSQQITSIYQDRFYFIWIGTESGIQRFDGINFYTYISSDKDSGLRERTIRAIYEDKDDNLWIATSNYLNKYNRETDNFTPYQLPNVYQADPLQTTLPSTILEDDKGSLWVAGGTDGLYYYDKQNEEFISYEHLSVRNINSMSGGGEDILWLATNGNGLVKLHTDSGKTEIFRNNPDDPKSISSNTISDIVRDHEGTLWIGTSGMGLNKMVEEKGRISFNHYKHVPGDPHTLGNNFIYKLFIDLNGDLWAGNDNGGLHLYNRDKNLFYHYRNETNNPYSLSHHSISYIYQDRARRLWVGTGLSGLNVYDEFAYKFEHFNTVRTMGGLNNNIIRDFLEDDEGNIWIATDGGGLNYFNRSTRTFTAFTHNPEDTLSIGSDAALTVKEGPDGSLWIGTWGGSVNILTDKPEGTFISFQKKYGIDEYPITNVFDIHFDRQYNYIWLATFGEGLYRYNQDNGQMKLFNIDPDDPASLSSNNLFRIYEDSKNNIWIGTYDGLNLLTSENKVTGIFKTFTKDDSDATSLSGNGVRQILEDLNQNIWVATLEGLSKYDEEAQSFINYYSSDGLPSNDIRSIVEDNNGHFWVGTLMGLSHFDPFSHSFKNFNKNNGLQGDEFSRYAVRKLSTGELLFGGNNGFNLFHPDRIIDNPHPPHIYLTDFKLFNKHIDFNLPDTPLNKHISQTDTLVLSYKHSVITFDFIALNYTRPEHNQYAYMVEGFEEDWNYVGTQRNATYTNLDPGQYIFRVKASNNNGLWNETGTSLLLIITPPLWQTAWFYMLSILFITGLIITIYRLRVRSIREHNRKLEQQVADRTEELEDKNNDLLEAMKELEATKDELVDKAHKAGMADIAAGVIHNVGNILNSVSISAELIQDSVKNSKIEKLSHANTILRENIDQLETFISGDPKGKKLMEYYLALEEPLKNEQISILELSERLRDKINLISEVITAQEIHVGADIYADQTSLLEMIDSALTLQAGSIEKHGLVVEKELQTTDLILAQRSKLIHVLVNLFKNAKESMAGNTAEEKKIIIKTWQENDLVFLSVRDMGAGIKPENLNKIFTHGFTTKENGHGFGLHNSANSLKEMGGKIEVKSDGEGKGAIFIMSFPAITELVPDSYECIS